MTPVVIIGGGVAELIAAEYLRREGRETIVIEEHRGFHGGWIPESIERDLDLRAHGFRADPREPCVTPDMLTGRDVARWPRFCERMRALAAVLEAIYRDPPPDPFTTSPRGFAGLATAALRVRALGADGVTDLLRVLPMSAADWLDEWFDDEKLKAVLAAASVRDLAQGPRSGGTAFNLLHQHVGNPAGVFAPWRSNAARVLRERSAARLRNARVERVEVREGRVRGVVLDSGETIATTVVLSGAHPARTLTGLVDPAWLDPELLRGVGCVRARGVAARVTLTAAHGLPSIPLPDSVESIERAYDDVKHGRISDVPVIEAQASGGAIDVHVQYVPWNIPAAEREPARRSVAERVTAALAPHVSDIRIERVLLPQDMETEFGWPQGQPQHAEIALDQAFWMRPVPQLAQYATPIRGLYLCSPANHPGIPALTGANAVKALLRAER